MKILLVDDSLTMRRIQKMVLQKMGHTDVTEAGDGIEALGKLASGGFDLVLMDLNMPNMNGLEAIKIMKADPNLMSIPVIMVTSESEQSKINEAVESGAADYILKPFQSESLAEKLKAYNI